MVDWLLVLSVVLAASDSVSVSKELELCEEDVILGDEVLLVLCLGAQ